MKKIGKTSWEEEAEGIYSEDMRETFLEDDEIDGWEEAFMHGYDEAG